MKNTAREVHRQHHHIPCESFRDGVEQGDRG
jgi:hypothetical protein